LIYISNGFHTLFNLMSTFRLKPEKLRQHVDIKTLDETHRKKVNDFKKQKDVLPNKRSKLEKLEKKLETVEHKDRSLYTNEDIILRSKLKTEISKLRDEIYDTEHNVSEIEYYSKSDDILMDYYDIMEHEDDTLYENNPELENEKIISESEDPDSDSNKKKELCILDQLNIIKKSNQKIKATVRKKKFKSTDPSKNSIFNYLEIETKDEEKEEDSNKSCNNKAELYEQYVLLNDNKRYSNIKKDQIFDISCEECNKDKVLLQAAGGYVCQDCGSFDMLVIESENGCGEGGGGGDCKAGYPYKRKNHFSESKSRVSVYIYTKITLNYQC
jgi:BMFP domain-containing protein YqiC